MVRPASGSLQSRTEIIVTGQLRGIRYKMGIAPLAAAAGSVLAGVGIYKAGHGASKASQRFGNLADRTGDILEGIRDDVRDIKVFFKERVEKVWPDIEHILNQTQIVLDRAENFLVMGTFMVKVLTLVFALCAVFITMNLLSKSALNSNRRRKNTPSIFYVLEHVVLQTIHSLGLVLALMLAILIIGDIFDFTWPNTIPFIIVIPSLATVCAVLQSIREIVYTIGMLIRYVLYLIIELPINLIYNPVSRGSNYTKSSYLLTTIFFIFYALLYFVVTFFPLQLFLRKVNESNITSILTIALLGYIIFYLTSVVTYILGCLILSYCIRPMWGFYARRNLRR